jgi:soluble lytic murein transglycosylase-like protein
VDRSDKQLLTWLGLGAAGVMLVKAFQSAQDPTSFVNDPVSAMSEAVQSLAGWKSVGNAAQWLPTLNAAEDAAGIPTDLLARIAYEESHFRESIIRGTHPSTAGALGIMQLMPQYFQSVRVAIPFTDSDVASQITEAANFLASLYTRFQSWELAVAAYNAGAGNVQKYGGVPPFAETQKYVTDIMADVPVVA